MKASTAKSILPVLTTMSDIYISFYERYILTNVGFFNGTRDAHPIKRHLELEQLRMQVSESAIDIWKKLKSDQDKISELSILPFQTYIVIYLLSRIGISLSDNVAIRVATLDAIVDESSYLDGLSKFLEYDMNGIITLKSDLCPFPSFEKHIVAENNNDMGALSFEEVKQAPVYIIEPKVSLEKVILSKEILDRVKRFLDDDIKSKAYQDWGLEESLEKGKTRGLLLYGEPGTGKTMLAEAIAYAKNRKLLVLDLAQVSSPLVGMTEKKIEAVFRQLEDKKDEFILLIDEADALLSSRTEIHHAVDAYRNTSVNLLLQKIERFDGYIILTTNAEIETGLDQALLRRIRERIKVTIPETPELYIEFLNKLLESLIPKKFPIVNSYSEIALEIFKFTGAVPGAYIKNIIQRAASIAMTDGSTTVTLDHFSLSASQEFTRRKTIGFKTR